MTPLVDPCSLSLYSSYIFQVKIWDTAGSEKYMSISAVYYRKADGVIFIFDVTKPRSFTNVETIWMNAVDAPERLVAICLTVSTDY